jgi:hypothetical protein
MSRRRADCFQIATKIMRLRKHKLVFAAGAFAALYGQHAQAQLTYTNEQFSESASASVTGETPASQTEGNGPGESYNTFALAVAEPTSRNGINGNAAITATQLESTNLGSIDLSGNIKGSTDAVAPATASATGSTMFSVTFQVSTPQGLVLNGELEEYLGTNTISLSESGTTLYQAQSSAPTPYVLDEFPSEYFISYQVLLMPGESYTLQENSSMTCSGDVFSSEGINAFSLNATIVPEPSTSAITLLAACGLIRGRRQAKDSKES